jgi:hypothetical protein
MGNSATTRRSPSPSENEEPSSIAAYLPPYYQPEITPQDIQICSHIWVQIIDDCAPAPPAASGQTYNSIRHWFYSALSALITQEMQSNESPFDFHLFLEGILQLIPISLRQFQNRSHFQNHFQFFAKSCSEIGITFTHFNEFGRLLFSVISLVDPSQPEAELCWMKLYSSILAVVLPVMIHQQPLSSTHPKTSQGQPRPAIASSSSSSATCSPQSHPQPASLTLNPQAPPFLPTHPDRYYTSMENVIL